MKKARMVAAALVGILLLLCARHAGAQPLADKLPVTTVAYYGWTPSPAIASTKLGKMLADEQLMKPLRNVLQQALLNMNDNADDDGDAPNINQEGNQIPLPASAPATGPSGGGTVMGDLPRLLEIAMHCEGCVAVVDARLIRMKLQAELVLILKLGDQRNAFEASWAPIQAHLATRFGDSIKEEKRDHAHLYKLTVEGKPPLTWGFVDDLFICYSGDRGPLLMPNLLREKGELKDTLVNNEEFLESVGAVKVDAKSPVVSVAWIDGKRGLGLLRTALKDGHVADRNAPDAAITNFFKSIGLDDLQAVVEKVSIEHDQFISRTLLRTKTPPHGLMASLVQPAVDDDLLKAVPPDAMFVASMRMDARKMFKEGRDSVFAIGGDDARQAMGNMPVAGQALMGMVVDKVLGSLGDQWVVYNAASNGGTPFSGWTLVATVRDAKTLDGVLQTVIQQVAQNAGSSTHDVDAQGVTIHFVVEGGGPDILSFINPAWTIVDGHLIISTCPQSVEDAIRQLKAEKSILDDADFLAMRQRIGNEGPMVYISNPNLVRSIYPLGGILLAEIRAFNSGMGGRQDSGIASPEMIGGFPSQRHLLELVGPDGGCLKLTSNGLLRTRSIANPALSVFTVPEMILSIQYVLSRTEPQTTTDDSPRGQAMKNLQILDTACMEYAADHKNALGSSLEQMIKATNNDPEILKSPYGPATNGPSIVYLYFNGLTTDIPGTKAAELVIAYDASELERDQGTTVLYLDGHTEFVEKDNFQATLDRSKKQQAALEKKP